MLKAMPALQTLLCLLLLSPGAWAETKATDRVMALFDEAEIVCLGERHWSKQDSDFRIALVRHPEFPDRVGNVVIEFGNSLHQDILDDYLLRLKELPNSRLTKVWRNTTQLSGVWDSPLYEQFIREVRHLNERLPQKKHIRVIAGGPPIDWSRVQVFEDQLPFSGRGWSGVRQIERQVLARGEKAIVIYGYGHFLRMDDEMEEEDNILRRLEGLYPEKTFRVVVPLVAGEEKTAALSAIEAKADSPGYIDAHSEPFRDWQAEKFLSGAAGTIGQAVDGLIYYGEEKDQLVKPHETFYQDHPRYSEELERRRGLKRRLKRFQSYN